MKLDVVAQARNLVRFASAQPGQRKALVGLITIAAVPTLAVGSVLALRLMRDAPDPLATTQGGTLAIAMSVPQGAFTAQGKRLMLNSVRIDDQAIQIGGAIGATPRQNLIRVAELSDARADALPPSLRGTVPVTVTVSPAASELLADASGAAPAADAGLDVITGRPGVVPPPRPGDDTAQADTLTGAVSDRLASIRPRPRPGSGAAPASAAATTTTTAIAEQTARLTTPDPLAGLRPRPRPTNAAEAATSEAAAARDPGANPLDTPRPRPRPRRVTGAAVSGASDSAETPEPSVTLRPRARPRRAVVAATFATPSAPTPETETSSADAEADTAATSPASDEREVAEAENPALVAVSPRPRPRPENLAPRRLARAALAEPPITAPRRIEIAPPRRMTDDIAPTRPARAQPAEPTVTAPRSAEAAPARRMTDDVAPTRLARVQPAEPTVTAPRSAEVAPVGRMTDDVAPVRLARATATGDAATSNEATGNAGLHAAASSCPSRLASGIPRRRPGAPGGSVVMAQVAAQSGAARDRVLAAQLLAGNLPPFLRVLTPVTFSGHRTDGQRVNVTVCVTPDYLALGSARDFVRVPLGLPAAAQVADSFGFMLPTTRIVDAVYAQAGLRLAPRPMQAGPQMRSTAYLQRHNATIEGQRQAAGRGNSNLIAGLKKDLVLSNALRRAPGRVAIYGWHRSNGHPIQPLSTVHGEYYSDYSHGVRLVSRTAYVNGRAVALADILQDPAYAGIISKEGPIRAPLQLMASLHHQQ